MRGECPRKHWSIAGIARIDIQWLQPTEYQSWQDSAWIYVNYAKTQLLIDTKGLFTLSNSEAVRNSRHC